MAALFFYPKGGFIIDFSLCEASHKQGYAE